MENGFTVAKARVEPLSLGCVPKSADTAVVISAYGPFARKPTRKSKNTFKPALTGPYCRKRNN